MTQHNGCTLRLTIGENYQGENALTWTGAEEDQWPDLTGAIVFFASHHNHRYLRSKCRVVSPAGYQEISVEITADETRQLLNRGSALKRLYEKLAYPRIDSYYAILATLSNGDVFTLVEGRLEVEDASSTSKTA